MNSFKGPRDENVILGNFRPFRLNDFYRYQSIMLYQFSLIILILVIENVPFLNSWPRRLKMLPALLIMMLFVKKKTENYLSLDALVGILLAKGKKEDRNMIRLFLGI